MPGKDAMKVIPTDLNGVMIIDPDVFGDHRGFFLESYHKERYSQAGIKETFVQDNLSFSTGNTLRGLHYQHPQGQDKLVQVLEGEVYDVAVDIRYGSPGFGRWTAAILSSVNRRQFFIPEGFAHGFCVLSDTALFYYKCSGYYAPQHEGGICWDDPQLGIDWPVDSPTLSERDHNFQRLVDINPQHLPAYRG
jgi:dTDP-4-dehydrorhamnose 3,5-epimerase